MGTTAEKFARTFQTKADLRNTINTYLGQDITNIAPFKDYETYIRNFYNQAPKTAFQTGTDITIENGLKGKLDFEKVYQEVEYIESSGTQYIDTGYIANNNTSEISVKFNATHTQNSGGFVFGGEVGFQTYACHLYNSSSKLDIGFGTYELTDVSYDANVLYEIIIQKGKYIVNGNEYTASRLTGDIQTDNSIYLFALNRGSGAIFNANDQIKMYHFAIKENNVLVRDMIPCYRKSDNVIGMYDKVNNKFYTNAGTGTFTKGADVGSGFNDIAGFGQNSQESTTGKNLLNYINNLNTNTSGLISTINNDGSITTTGKPTSDYASLIGYDITSILENGERYYISQKSLQTNLLFLQVNIKDNTTQETTICSLNSGTSNSFVADTTNKTYRMKLQTETMANWGANNRTITNFYQLEKGSSATNFEKYTGGYASPSPNWEQQVKCVAGRNKLPVPYAYSSQTRDGITFTINDDGSVKANGTATGNATFVLQFQSQELRNLLLKNDCMLSGCPSGGSGSTYKLQLYGYNSSGTGSLADTGSGVSLASFENETNGFNIAILILTGTTVNNIVFKPMLEIGTQVTPYLPYNTIEEVVEKTIADVDSTIIGQAWNLSSNSARACLYVEVEPETDYVIAYNNLNGIEAINRIEKASQSDTSAIVSSLISESPTTITTRATTNWLVIQFSKTNITLADVQGMGIRVRKSSDTPATYQLSLGDLEFFEIVRNSSSIVRDKIIKMNGKFYKEKNVGKVEVDSTLNPSISLTSTNTARVVFSNLLANNPPMTISGVIGYSNYFKQNANWGTDAEGFFYDAGNYALWFRGNKSTIGATEEAILSWVHANKPYFIYPLATPVLEEITDETLISQLNAWYNAQSIKGTTIIESNGDLPLIIKVRALKAS